MAKGKKVNETAIKYIIIAVLVFLLRYVPFYKVWEGKYTSIDGMQAICNSILGTFANYCNWAKPANTILIIAAIISLTYGLYILYKKK